MKKTVMTGYFLIIIVIIFVLGYIQDINDVVHYILSNGRLIDISALMVFKIIGVFIPPLGGILGWF